ncbi:hypothetical protein V4D30_04825 [Thermodesulfovibrio sp. 3907-1M]|uniref:Uncharacterized protein n=1 Tax=Thermodesulfovibrio autotrophicus TaxID=3118333 RepID=A0AAU8GYK9_9BACT
MKIKLLLFLVILNINQMRLQYMKLMYLDVANSIVDLLIKESDVKKAFVIALPAIAEINLKYVKYGPDAVIGVENGDNEKEKVSKNDPEQNVTSSETYKTAITDKNSN